MFVVVMDWTDERKGQPWTNRLVPDHGHARFRAHTTEVYVDGTGLVEVRDTTTGRVLFRRLGSDDAGSAPEGVL